MPVEMLELNIGAGQREMEEWGTPVFPCGCYYKDLDHAITGNIPGHWHEEVELAVVLHGAVRVMTGEARYVIREGEGIFLNTNVLHAAYKADSGECRLSSLKRR